MKDNYCIYCKSSFKIRSKMFVIFTIFIVSIGIWINGLNAFDFTLLIIGIYISYRLYKKGLRKVCTNKNCICFSKLRLYKNENEIYEN